MTAGIDAGTTLAEVARVLGEHGQWIPFDAPLPARATVGGTLAAGWAGPRRAAYGRPRDLVIGSTVALPTERWRTPAGWSSRTSPATT